MVHWKIQLLGGGRGSQKNNIEGGLPKNDGLGQFANLRVGLARKWGGVLEGGWYPNAHYELSQNHLTHVLIQPSVIASNWCVRP